MLLDIVGESSVNTVEAVQFRRAVGTIGATRRRRRWPREALRSSGPYCRLPCWPPHNIELSEDAAEYGRQAQRL